MVIWLPICWFCPCTVLLYHWCGLDYGQDDRKGHEWGEVWSRCIRQYMFAGRITVTAVLEAMDDKANAVGLEVNWDKTKVEALGTHQSDQEVLDIHGHQAAVVSEFVYLGTLAQSSVYSSYDIHRHSGFTRSAMQNSDNCIWKSQLALSTKLQLYNICILPLVLYGSQC